MSADDRATAPSFGAARLAEETRERFVREILARVPLARLVELHLFPAMRQGGVESGVGVLAARLDPPAAAAPEAAPCDPTDDAGGPAPEPEPSADDGDATESRAPRRHTVFTARYRLVLKGPERGRWDVEVREEADAPLVTVEAVVRGVQARAGDGAYAERYDAAQVAQLVGVRPDAR